MSDSIHQLLTLVSLFLLNVSYTTRFNHSDCFYLKSDKIWHSFSDTLSETISISKVKE